MKFLWAVLMSFALPVISQTMTKEGNFKFEPSQRKLFSLWDEESEILVAAEMLIDEYPEQTLMSKIINSRQELDLSTPEGLIAYEYNLILKADLETILENYHDEADKAYGSKLYHNIKHRQDWNIKNVKDIEYRTKAAFGDLIRIKCKKIKKAPGQFSISWNSLCKQYGKRYYFVSAQEENALFSILAEAFPFWDKKRMQWPENKIQGLSKVSFDPVSSNSAQAEASKVDVYLRINQFNDDKEVHLKEEVQELLKKLRSLYIENNKDELLNLWLPQSRENVKSDIFNSNVTYKHSQAYFQDSDGITADFYIGIPNVLFVFGRRIVHGKVENNIKIFKFIRENGKLYFTDSMKSLYLEEKKELYFTEKVIEHPQLMEFYNQIVKK